MTNSDLLNKTIVQQALCHISAIISAGFPPSPPSQSPSGNVIWHPAPIGAFISLSILPLVRWIIRLTHNCWFLGHFPDNQLEIAVNTCKGDVTHCYTLLHTTNHNWLVHSFMFESILCMAVVWRSKSAHQAKGSAPKATEQTGETDMNLLLGFLLRVCCSLLVWRLLSQLVPKTSVPRATKATFKVNSKISDFKTVYTYIHIHFAQW